MGSIYIRRAPSKVVLFNVPFYFLHNSSTLHSRCSLSLEGLRKYLPTFSDLWIFTELNENCSKLVWVVRCTEYAQCQFRFPVIAHDLPLSYFSDTLSFSPRIALLSFTISSLPHKSPIQCAGVGEERLNLVGPRVASTLAVILPMPNTLYLWRSKVYTNFGKL